MPKYFGYARVSTEEQDKKYSIGIQKEYLQKQAKILGYQFEFFYDAVSGSTFNRAGWNTLTSVIQPGDVLGAAYNDRIGRNTEQSLSITKELFYRGIRIQVGGVEFDFNNANDELMFSMFAIISTFQRKNQNKKSREGIKSKKTKGEWIFRGDLYGYNLIKEPHGYRAEINEPEAELLRFIYKEYATGRSIKNICEELNRKGYLNRHNSSFYWASVRRWLMKPIYMGYYKEETAGRNVGQDKIKFDENTLVKSKIYPAIIEPSLWKSVFNSYRTVRRTHTKQFEYRFSEYELSGLIKCGHCLQLGFRTTFVHNFHKSPTGKVNSNYTCKIHKTKCGQAWFTLRAEVLEHLIRSTYYIEFAHHFIMIDLVNEKRENIRHISDSIIRQLEYYNGQKLQLDTQEKNLIKAVAKGMDSDVVMEEIQNIKTEKKIVDKKIAGFEEEIRGAGEDIDLLIDELQESKLLEFIHSSSSLKRKQYRLILEDILIYNNNIIIKYKTKLTIVVHLEKNRGRTIQLLFNCKVMYQGKYIYSYTYDKRTDEMNIITQEFTDPFKAEIQWRYREDFNELIRKVEEYKNVVTTDM